MYHEIGNKGEPTPPFGHPSEEGNLSERKLLYSSHSSIPIFLYSMEVQDGT